MTAEWIETIIIGGGAAGLSAAQSLGRARRGVLVLDTGLPRNRFADRMHNVLGHDGVAPAELLEIGRREAAEYDVRIESAAVRAVREPRDGEAAEGAGGADRPGAGETRLVVELEDGRSIGTRAVVLASGVTDVLPEIPGLVEQWGRGVAHCPYCHGWEVRGERIAVLATSPMSLHQVQLLRQWTDDLTVFAAALGELPEETLAELRARNIRLIEHPVAEVLGDESGVLRSVRTEDGRLHLIDALFTFGSIRPNDDMVAALGLARAEAPFGSFLAVDPLGRTSHPRIWAAGNLVNPSGAVPLAVSSGSMAGGGVNLALAEADFARAAATAATGESR
ncbi:NAD(P)/FAD-dependent oxidoreductase [Leucobacter sp. HNU]|uniref:NAD(P)/FAD-dependent oxidoreductase n=1 Tax=Leucobacter sp. HNU TaxID=3236805 RepID=UPI003A7F9CDC